MARTLLRSAPLPIAIASAALAGIATVGRWLGEGALPANLAVSGALLAGAVASGVGRRDGSGAAEPFRQRLLLIDVALRTLWMAMLGVAAVWVAAHLGLERERRGFEAFAWIIHLEPLARHYHRLPARPTKWLWPIVIAAGMFDIEFFFTFMFRARQPAWELATIGLFTLASFALCALAWRETPPDRSTR